MMKGLYRWCLIPLFEGLCKGRRTFQHLRTLEESQWLPREELATRQLQALRRLLTHAYTSCPYYHNAWTQAGLDPRAVRTLEDFTRWPVLDREVIRAHRSELRTCLDGLRLYSKSTGGSSGTPLHFDFDSDSNDRRMAAWHRGYGWAGAELGTRQLYLWGVPLGQRSRWQRWKDSLYHGLYRRQMLNSFELSESRLTDFLTRLNAYCPEVIVAYTGALYTFARMLAERNLRPHAPRSIVVGAEKLYPFQRQLIQDVFRAPVFETYGSREVMLIGAECERHEGLHLSMENLLVEILDDAGQPVPAGEEGNVVVTDLFNYGMPFVRYANGDRAVAGWGQCSCGRGLPLLQRVVGRRLDVLHTVDGRRIPGEFFPHLLKDFPEVKRFQVVQDTPRHIELRVVLAGGFRDGHHGRLRAEIARVIGTEQDFDLVQVEDIPLSSSGKLQVVVNRCGNLDQVREVQPCST